MDKKNSLKRRVAKKKRVLPYRKWSDYETTLLVDYIKENELEKPSGRIFYQNFVQTFNMNINWSLVKNKLRNLKTLYEKAVAWERSDAAKDIPEGESVQSIMNRICPFYDSLKQVFGDRLNKNKTRAVNQYSSKLEIEYSQDTVIKSSYSPPSSPQHVSEHQTQQCSEPIHENITICDNIDNESTGSVVIYQQKSCQTENITDDVAVKNTYRIKSESGSQEQEHNACNCLMEMVKVMTSYQKESSEHKKARLELEFKKFDFEKEKTFRDLELRQREIEKNERLQVLEIESKERIALKELEYKYKQRF